MKSNIDFHLESLNLIVTLRAVWPGRQVFLLCLEIVIRSWLVNNWTRRKVGAAWPWPTAFLRDMCMLTSVPRSTWTSTGLCDLADVTVSINFPLSSSLRIFQPLTLSRDLVCKKFKFRSPTFDFFFSLFFQYLLLPWDFFFCLSCCFLFSFKGTRHPFSFYFSFRLRIVSHCQLYHHGFCSCSLTWRFYHHE